MISSIKVTILNLNLINVYQSLSNVSVFETKSDFLFVQHCIWNICTVISLLLNLMPALNIIDLISLQERKRNNRSIVQTLYSRHAHTDRHYFLSCHIFTHLAYFHSLWFTTVAELQNIQSVWLVWIAERLVQCCSCAIINTFRIDDFLSWEDRQSLNHKSIAVCSKKKKDTLDPLTPECLSCILG